MCKIQGVIIPNTENNKHNFFYKKGEGDKKSFISILLSIADESGVKDSNGYIKTYFAKFKAFGATADLINTYFKPKDGILVDAHYTVEEGQLKEDGTKYSSQPVFVIDKVHFWRGNMPEFKNDKKSEEKSSSAAKAAPAAAKETFDVFNI